MINLNTWSPERIKEYLTKQEEQYKAVEAKRKEKIVEQIEIFNDTANRLAPAIEYLFESNYNFTHPDLDVFSFRGPVLDYDAKNNLMYVYSEETRRVTRVDLYTEEATTILNKDFFTYCNFDHVMKGLLYTLELHQRYIIDCSDDIATRQELIEKYRIN
ncbi:hypothetical protein EEL31_23800 [Brevibacillus laterosporus]|nr:hypothetical protein [Brevibacillus laterosporus]TPG71156.1 hypothetical protein EEL31_23800 [Brevibacillus laterosporus]